MNPVLASFYNSPHRRNLTVLLFVLLGHVLLIWLLIQNRWIVVSETTVTFMPPIMVSIVLSQANTSNTRVTRKNDKPDSEAKAPPTNRLDGDLVLKSTRQLSFGALRVQRSVPWLNTELLPDLRGNNADSRADREEHAGSADKEPRSQDSKTEPVRASASRSERKVAAKNNTRNSHNARHAEPLMHIPPPPSEALQLILPPPQPQLQPAPPVAAARPTAPVPSIPEPAQSGLKDIPPLRPQTPTPPPVLVLIPPIPPTPPQLKTIAPVPVTAVPPADLNESPPEPTRTEPPPPLPRVAATVTPPAPPKTVQAAAPPELSASPPMALTPSVALPTPTQPSLPMASNVIVVPLPAQELSSVPTLQTLPTLPISSSTAPPSAPKAGATAATPLAVRNPMVVEVPRYSTAEPSPSATVVGPGGSGNAAVKTDNAGNSGRRAGPDSAGSQNGSVFGMGIAAPEPAPPALPTATAPNSAKAKALNLTLPRVEVYRWPSMGRQQSLSEMANAQLRRGEPKDPLADAVNSAENPDCVKPDKDGSGGGLLAAPIMTYKALTGKCK